MEYEKNENESACVRGMGPSCELINVAHRDIWQENSDRVGRS